MVQKIQITITFQYLGDKIMLNQKQAFLLTETINDKKMSEVDKLLFDINMQIIKHT